MPLLLFLKPVSSFLAQGRWRCSYVWVSSRLRRRLDAPPWCSVADCFQVAFVVAFLVSLFGHWNFENDSFIDLRSPFQASSDLLEFAAALYCFDTISNLVPVMAACVSSSLTGFSSGQ
ncbi:unnamed protein product [Arabis nemorensis]|uniref:Uncharacterized protein n=1 Tax=Arabis nemorensis TaxID=586526 RepID=A0A565AV07_9BRAS|nr:unnamed protein product [Arabis nemorensis]